MNAQRKRIEKKNPPGPTDDNKQVLEKGIMSLQKRSRVCCFSGRIALFAWIQNKSTSLHGDRPTTRAKGRSGVTVLKGSLEYSMEYGVYSLE